MSERVYDFAHFIAKFEAIPEEWWCVGQYCSAVDERVACAFGHCGARNGHFSHEADALFAVAPLADDVNDGAIKQYTQPTPKQRVLAYLRDQQARAEGFGCDWSI
jgi:hypothetical protein